LYFYVNEYLNEESFVYVTHYDDLGKLIIVQLSSFNSPGAVSLTAKNILKSKDDCLCKL